MKRSISKSKRGISPILATLLLIVIAVAAIVVTYAWVITYMSGTTQRAGEELVVENILFSGSDQINITLRSTGTSDTTVAAIYAGTSSAGLIAQTNARLYPDLPKIVSAGSSQVFNLNYTWTTGTRYYFKAVTESGYSLPFNQKP